jgi:polysaccharide biosynthesis transport protein
MEDVIAAFESRLKINRVGVSWVIEISFSSANPERAAQIANAVANVYIVDQLEAKYRANRTAENWLQDRLEPLGEQASTSQRAIEEFKEQNKIITADGKPLDQQKVVDLNSRLVAARAQSADALARRNELESIIRANPSYATFDAAVSEIVNTPIITTLRQQYLELTMREAEYSSRFGRDHLAVVNLRNRMQELRASMLDELKRFVETSRNDYEISRQRQEEIEKQFADAVAQSRATGQAQVALRRLESDAAGYRNLYESFLQHYMGSAQQETFPISEARILFPASASSSKRPKSFVVLVISLMGGVGFGCALGMLRESMDRAFRTRGQLEAALQRPCIALVPFVKTSPAKESLQNQIVRCKESGGHSSDARNANLLKTVIEAPLSSFTEAIRSIKLAVDLQAGGSGKVIGFTSSLPNEGKSTIAASLATLISQVNGRVILLDCDLRNPSLSRMLLPDASVGIVEAISGSSSREEATWRDSKTKIAFLPAVRKRPIFHSSDILASDAMRRLFDELRTEYEYVVVDLPPLAPVIDVRATTHLIDSYVLIVEWGRTTLDVVEQGLRSSPGIYNALIGAVLNKTDMAALTRYDIHRRTLYYNKHFIHYE